VDGDVVSDDVDGDNIGNVDGHGIDDMVDDKEDDTVDDTVEDTVDDTVDDKENENDDMGYADNDVSSRSWEMERFPRSGEHGLDRDAGLADRSFFRL
jgi:hypothetical protein